MKHPVKKYKDKVSGSFASSVIDSNDDGIPGIVGEAHGKSSLGPLSVSFFTEFDLSGAAPSANCPADFLELPLVTSRTIHRYGNGDFLYLSTESEIFCGNFATGDFHWTEKLVLIGGTGRFSNATGHLTLTGSGTTLVSGASGVTNFGAISMKNNGRIKRSDN